MGSELRDHIDKGGLMLAEPELDRLTEIPNSWHYTGKAYDWTIQEWMEEHRGDGWSILTIDEKMNYCFFSESGFHRGHLDSHDRLQGICVRDLLIVCDLPVPTGQDWLATQLLSLMAGGGNSYWIPHSQCAARYGDPHDEW